MRLAALIVLTSALAGPAAAQIHAPGSLAALHAENRLAAEQELSRQQALAAGRQAFAAESRARTTGVLQSMQTRLPDLPVILAPLDPEMQAEAAAIAALQDRVLAESNARIRAIKPASAD